MNGRVLLPMLACAVLRSFAVAQTESPAVPSASPSTSSSTVAIVPEGMPVRVRLAQPLSAAKAHVGDAITLEVLEDASEPNHGVVIHKGAPAYGHVTEARAARRLSRRGTLTLAIDSVEAVSGERIPMRAERQVQGQSATEMTVGRITATALLAGAPIASLWLLKHGHDADLPTGTSFVVFVSQTTQVDIQKSLAAPPNQSLLTLYQLAFLRGDADAMEKQTAAAQASPSDDTLLSAQSDTESYYGHLAKARELTQRAVTSALKSGQKESAAIWQANGALHEAEVGNRAEARQLATAALALSSSKDVETLAALAFARAGDAKHAQSLATKLQEKFRADTALNTYWLPTIDGAIQLDRGKPKNTLVSLQPASPHAMDTPLPLQTGTLYPIFVRAEALLALREGSAAGAASATILDHPGIVVNFPVGSLAHLQLARAYHLQSNTDKACAEYRAFLKLWQDADSDIPILQQAKREESVCAPN